MTMILAGNASRDMNRRVNFIFCMGMRDYVPQTAMEGHNLILLILQ